MARNCNCDGFCHCAIAAGLGVSIDGSGSVTDPYVISSEGLSGTLEVIDTETVNMSLDGGGTPSSPFVLSAAAQMVLNNLLDVDAPSPANGDTMVWVVDHWEAQQPSQTPPGAVSTGPGLAGDGSQLSPLEVRTSGTWGTPPLDGYGSNDTIGQVTYVDSLGEVRAQPVAPDSERIAGYEVVVSETDPGNPATDRIWIQPV